MSYLPCPHCDERIDVFGTGGGAAVADTLTRLTGAPVPLLGEVPIDPRLREAGDAACRWCSPTRTRPRPQQLTQDRARTWPAGRAAWPAASSA